VNEGTCKSNSLTDQVQHEAVSCRTIFVPRPLFFLAFFFALGEKNPWLSAKRHVLLLLLQCPFLYFFIKAVANSGTREKKQGSDVHTDRFSYFTLVIRLGSF
jgi:hypothetical protein